MSHGGDRKSEESREQNVPLIPTAEKIAQQHGISHMAVKRAEKFADGVDNSRSYPLTVPVTHPVTGVGELGCPLPLVAGFSAANTNKKS
ncbi:hypothetical protein SPSYN_03019 [Sporotomaculum syntrophicum]|uniref:Uncharacterized protein n=2 Tax=Sporotomaculum syntrophicum TaxID=182264 RepID=A0A9D3AXP7_9FIRM|nr:hypothetical protein SPSYN_03019 [Sporotomaculum syntrophicum]